MHLEWLIVNCLKNMHFGHLCLLVKDGLQPISCKIMNSIFFENPFQVIIMAPLTSKARMGTKALRSPEDADFRLGPNADRA